MAAIPLHASGVYLPLRSVTRLVDIPLLWQMKPAPTFALIPRFFLRRFLPPSFAWRHSFALPSLLAPLLELFPSVVLAVPKKKVSHSRKSMRSANKGLKDKLNIVCCPACGKPKLSHNLCPNCYSQISRGYKSTARPRAEISPASRVAAGESV